MGIKDKTWILISFLILVIAVIWLAIVVRDSLTKPTLPENLEEISKPLNPSLDPEVFRELETRTKPWQQ